MKIPFFSNCIACKAVRPFLLSFLKDRLSGYPLTMVIYILTILVLIASLYSFSTGAVQELSPLPHCESMDLQCIEDLLEKL